MELYRERAVLNLRICIADPDPAARALLSDVARSAMNCSVVRECDNGFTALESIRTLSANVVFADARLPRIDGFSLLRHASLETSPAFVLTTHDDRDGLRAFTDGAVDCIGKPLDPDRCRRAVERARRHLVGIGAMDLGRRAAELLGTESAASTASAPPRYLSQVAVPDGRRSRVIPIASIEWVSAEDCYSRIFADDTSFLLRRTLRVLEGQLNPHEFVRTHRSALVSVQHVRDISDRGPNELSVMLKSGVAVPISQRRRTAVLRAFAR